jgi:SAM-dependent methyltransferase
MRTRNSQKQIREAFVERVLPLYDGYRDVAMFHQGAERIIFYATLVERLRRSTAQPHLLDLGGGLSPFAPLLVALGYRVTMIDDFGGGGGIDAKCRTTHLDVLERMRRLGVNVIEGNFLNDALPLPDSAVDIVTSFHSIEHWHSSPMPLLREVKRVLRRSGHLVIGCPNAVNLRKRLWVLLGRTNHCSLREWYYDGLPFRGHVREPTVSELRELLAWNQFDVEDVYGRNFIGEYSESLPAVGHPVWRGLLKLTDPVLRLAPTLCSDIHVVGRSR